MTALAERAFRGGGGGEPREDTPWSDSADVRPGAPPEWYGLALAVLAVGVVLAVGLYIDAHKSIWLDEAYSLNTARRPLGETIHRALYFELQAPLYFVLIHFWSKISASIEFVRVFSTLCAAATVWALFRLCRLLLPRRTWLSLALLGACCSQLLWAASEARDYALTLLLMTVALWLFARIWLAGSEHPWRDGTLYVLVGYAAMLNMYYTGFLLAALFIVALLDGAARRTLIATHVALAALMLPWIPVVRRQIAMHPHNTEPAGGVSLSAAHGLVGTAYWMANTLFGAVLRGTGDFVLRPAVLGFLAALLIGTIVARRAWRAASWTRGEIAIAGSTAITAAILLVLRYFNLTLVNQSKWVIIVPGVLALLAVAVGNVPSPRAMRVLAAGYTLFFALAAVSYERTCALVCSTVDWPSVATYLKTAARPGEPIIFAWSWDALPFTYYYGESAAVRAVSHADPWIAPDWWADLARDAPAQARVLGDSLPALIGTAPSAWVVGWHQRPSEPTPSSLVEHYADSAYVVLGHSEFGHRPGHDTPWLSVTHIAPLASPPAPAAPAPAPAAPLPGRGEAQP